MLQKTIKSSASCEGAGIHTGLKTRLVFDPAGENSGIVFVKDGRKLPAKIEFISGTNRGTSLKDIPTVEHVLSAINGLGIDNIIINVFGGEPPILDGSSIEYVNLLENAGIVEQPSSIKVFRIKDRIMIGENGAEISVSPSDRLIIEAYIEYPSSFFKRQEAVFDVAVDDYKEHIAPARTFGRLSEVEALKKQGLAKGASFDNAVAILEDRFSCPLRFPDELARHKILDIIGDIAFAGGHILGKIVSKKAGHRLNIELVRRIINAS